jgi:hypothetical protein
MASLTKAGKGTFMGVNSIVVMTVPSIGLCAVFIRHALLFSSYKNMNMLLREAYVSIPDMFLRHMIYNIIDIITEQHE